MSKDVNIDNYIRFYKKDDKAKECPPICREERQYALYLSNVLRYYGKDPQNRIRDNEKVKNIFKACGFNDVDLKNIVIENVYYEATFMRDFFERNRKIHFENDAKITEENKRLSFNLRLLKYCWCNYLKESKDELEDFIAEEIEMTNFEEKNYGSRNEIPFLKYAEYVKKNFKNEKEFKEECDSIENKREFSKDIKLRRIVRAMMNAKPDLAVIYYDNKGKGLRKLLFIECKYKSQEDKYKFYSYDVNEKVEKGEISQTKAQGYIANFLCGYYMKNVVELSGIMKKNNESKMVKFVTASAKDGEINIKDLIELEEDIFN